MLSLVETTSRGVFIACTAGIIYVLFGYPSLPAILGQAAFYLVVAGGAAPIWVQPARIF